MALLKSKAAKLAAQADATRLLEAAPASACAASFAAFDFNSAI